MKDQMCFVRIMVTAMLVVLMFAAAPSVSANGAFDVILTNNVNTAVRGQTVVVTLTLRDITALGGLSSVTFNLVYNHKAFTYQEAKMTVNPKGMEWPFNNTMPTKSDTIDNTTSYIGLPCAMPIASNNTIHANGQFAIEVTFLVNNDAAPGSYAFALRTPVSGGNDSGDVYGSFTGSSITVSGTNYTVSGYVKSPVGGDVKVGLMQGDTLKYSREAIPSTANAAVAFSIPNVTAGIYTLRVSKNHHATHTQRITVTSTTAVSTSVSPILLLLGDIDGNDGYVNTCDFAKLLSCYGTNDAMADLNKDGIVNHADLVILMNAYNK